jgi:hypothetical protein
MGRLAQEKVNRTKDGEMPAPAFTGQPILASVFHYGAGSFSG